MKPLLPSELPPNGFVFWKIDAKDAEAHPHGTQYAGMLHTPDGQLWGIDAAVVEVNGRKHFQGGLYPVDRYPTPDRAAIAKSIATASGQSVPACAESAHEHSPAQTAGKLSDIPPQGDLVEVAEAISHDLAELDDSAILEALP